MSPGTSRMNIEQAAAPVPPPVLFRWVVSIMVPSGRTPAIFPSQATSLQFLIEMAQLRNAENATLMQGPLMSMVT